MTCELWHVIMGVQKIWLIIWFSSVVCWLLYLTPFVFFLPISNSLVSCLSVKAAKEFLKERRKETKIPFKFQLYFGVSYGYSVAKKGLPGLLEKQSHLPNKVLKHISHFQRVLSPKSVVMSSWCFLWGMLAEMATYRRVISVCSRYV